jgi:hypothetical protein
VVEVEVYCICFLAGLSSPSFKSNAAAAVSEASASLAPAAAFAKAAISASEAAWRLQEAAVAFPGVHAHLVLLLSVLLIQHAHCAFHVLLRGCVRSLLLLVQQVWERK